ncbi:tRNA guanosine(34) transglycosylase Tgt [Candidatus Dojkabacteria bacterium]|nr:tRNA guanosine(34) transglycosylase Tgt [Candidatus Dojkabacteria bacterium]
MFQLTSTIKGVRKGILTTPHGDIQTPAFLPDATYGAVKMLSFQDVRSAGIDQILTTTLHMKINPGDKYIKRMGGLHSFFGWYGPILTDSGGWQVFSLIHQTGKGKVTEEGAEFILPTDGTKHKLTPEDSINIQANLRSDIMVVLDDPIIGDSSLKDNKRAVDITVQWAERAKQEFLKRYQLNDEKFDDPKKKRPLLFSVIQGGNYKKLRKECAEKLIEIGFDGYGYGGILLKDDKKTTRDMLKHFAGLVPEDKVRYGMGVGKPDDVEFCIKHGYDLFDCVVPTRNGRHGQCYTSFGSINLKSTKYKYDNRAIDRACDCEACKVINRHPAASRAYLHSLFKAKEITAMRLCSIHNLRYYSNMMRQMVG